MGEAREVMDRVTAAMLSRDFAALADCYAENVVAVTPEQGEISGREAVCAYLTELLDAFPDFSYESIQQHESGNWAIDEGYFGGTNTGPLVTPSGEALPGTGKRVRSRGCDIARVEDGRIVMHRFYYDQMDLMAQLGMFPETDS